jgi:hypothetical protein
VADAVCVTSGLVVTVAVALAGGVRVIVAVTVGNPVIPKHPLVQSPVELKAMFEQPAATQSSAQRTEVSKLSAQTPPPAQAVHAQQVIGSAVGVMVGVAVSLAVAVTVALAV